jgi:hypothetical protein
MVTVITNFPISYFLTHKKFEKLWVTVNKHAFRRRFTEVSIGDPTVKLCKSLGLPDKRAYACEIAAGWVVHYVSDVLKGILSAQKQAVSDPRRTVVRNLLSNRLKDIDTNIGTGFEASTPAPYTSPKKAPFTASKSLLSQTTPYKVVSEREAETKKEQFGEKFVEVDGLRVNVSRVENRTVAVTDQIATGGRPDLCPRYNLVRIRSPTRRTINRQLELFRAAKLRKCYFSRGLNKLEWELTHGSESRRVYDSEALKVANGEVFYESEIGEEEESSSSDEEIVSRLQADSELAVKKVARRITLEEEESSSSNPDE